MCSSRRRNGWRFSQEPWSATAPPVPTSFLCLQHSGKDYLDFAAIWASAVFFSTLHPVLTHGFVNYMPNVHTKHCCCNPALPSIPSKAYQAPSRGVCRTHPSVPLYKKLLLPGTICYTILRTTWREGRGGNSPWIFITFWAFLSVTTHFQFQAKVASPCTKEWEETIIFRTYVSLIVSI